MNQFDIQFVASGRGKAQCAPNPEFPNGKDIDLARGRLFCPLTLPYPAPECGYFLVRCRICKFSLAITAVGRPDDPKDLKIPCDLSIPGGHS